MAKKTLQAVGEDCITFDDTCYWVADNVKKFLSNFQPGQEVDITVKEDMVTFIKKSGFPTQPQSPKPAGRYQQQYQAPQTTPAMPQQPAMPQRPATPASVSTGGLNGNLDMLTAAIIKAWQLDVNEVKELAKQLKSL